MRLEGKVALVTGGAQGIGRQIALTFAREGARLMIGDVKDEGGRATVGEIEAGDGAAACRPCDIGRFDDVQALVDATVETYGRLDVLVNNAGIGIGQAVGEIGTKQLDIQLDVNHRAYVLFYRETAELLRAAAAETGAAVVVNTASIAGKGGQAWLSTYSATKAGVIGFTQAMNKELAGDGVKSCALCPGFVDTPMTDFVKGQVPVEEMITPGDIAKSVKLLLEVSPACVIPEIVFARVGEGI
jgi:NAD(P)-dependent dehydrogenase (short-subunit alcohol dehydrogenase family)